MLMMGDSLRYHVWERCFAFYSGDGILGLAESLIPL